MAYGLFFRAGDETGNRLLSDMDLHEKLSGDLQAAVIEELELDPGKDRFIISGLGKLYELLS
jgi:hypothetical protein